MRFKVDRQVFALAAAGALPLAVSLVMTPFLARSLSDEGLEMAGAILVAHAFFGIFDMFRPSLTRELVHIEGPVSLKSLTRKSLIVAIGASLLIAAISSVALPQFGVAFAISLGLSLFFFLMTGPFWARLEAVLRSGHAYLIRSLAIAMIFVGLVVVPLTIGEQYLPWVLLAGNAMSFALMLLVALPFVSIEGKPVHVSTQEIALVFGQNLVRSAGDFADRIAALTFLGTDASGKYNIVADLPVKSGVISQLASYYFYPRICKDDTYLGRYMATGMIISFAILSASIFFWVFGEWLYVLYFGERFQSLFPVFCFLVAAVGVNTLHFYLQSFMRSRKRNTELFLSFLLPSILGIGVYFVGAVDILTILLGIFLFRTSNVLLIFFSVAAGGKQFLNYLVNYVLGSMLMAYFYLQVDPALF
ncbi:lipopolysaccharide biosynthesis protein [Sphingomicrobium marinum]|uniref:lipopolysaccharide biosynthesis protein n=1 Tax=Sphingomicrobium marinum TaxID=1227950 RepID=UPI0022408FA8|nr:hypothetical protein [Sphingomicrobium marinum]